MDASPLPAPAWWHQLALIRRLLTDPTPVLDELAQRYGSMCRFGAGPMRIAVVGDPAALREMFAMPTEHFRWGHKFNVLGFVVGKESMIVSDGDDHARRRASVQTAFSRRRLNGWIPMIVERTDAAIDRLVDSLAGTEHNIDLYPFGRALVLEIVVRSMFGDSLAAQSSEIGGLFERPQAYLEAPAIRQFPHPFPGTTRSRARADRRALDAIIDRQISTLRAEGSCGPRIRPAETHEPGTSLSGSTLIDSFRLPTTKSPSRTWRGCRSAEALATASASRSPRWNSP